MDSKIKHFLNGALSGMVGLLISHPFDTIKTCIQDNKPVKYNLRSLYRGVLSPFFGVGLEKAIVFGTYTNTAHYLKTQQMNDIYINSIAGGLSGLSASFVVTPIERIKILLQTGTRIQWKGINFSYLFKGLSATFTRETPGFAIYFSVYEGMKKHNYTDYNQNIPWYMSFLYGGLSGAIAWVFIYPQDCIKTKLQACNDHCNKKSFIDISKELYKAGGLKIFYRGFHLALMRAVPLHAGTFMINELLKKYS